MVKVSVIVPVYNATNYLERCLDSLVNQTLDEIEFICVDDCSTDNSLEILTKYANNDKFKIIRHETNRGESEARNTGLINARGEYIGFLDNDDTVDLCFFDKLYQKAKLDNADICKGEVCRYSYSMEKLVQKNLNEEIRKNKLNFNIYFWSAIYKQDIIKNIRFNPSLKIGADVLFLNEVVLNTKKSISTVDGIFYYHFDREDSGYSKFLSKEKVDSRLRTTVKVIENLNKFNIYKTDLEYYNTYIDCCIKQIFDLACISDIKLNLNILGKTLSQLFKLASVSIKSINYLKQHHPIIYLYIEKEKQSELNLFILENKNYKKYLMQNLRHKFKVNK